MEVATRELGLGPFPSAAERDERGCRGDQQKQVAVEEEDNDDDDESAAVEGRRVAREEGR